MPDHLLVNLCNFPNVIWSSPCTEKQKHGHIPCWNKDYQANKYDPHSAFKVVW